MFIPLRNENPTHHFPLMTILLIAANVAVFAPGVLGDDVGESVKLTIPPRFSILLNHLISV
jgi:hypothetical protein